MEPFRERRPPPDFGNGLALDVHGRAKFSTAGAGTIPAQQNSVVVSDPAVTADSHITMTLTGDPGSSASGLPAVVVWIERQPGVGFIARLSRRVAFCHTVYLSHRRAGLILVGI